MSTAELKPCPFCLHKAEIHNGPLGELFAACTKCWCHMGGAWSSTKAGAIEAWNTRAAPPPEAEVVGMPRDVFDEALLLVSTLTDPKAKTPGRTDVARELLPKLRALLHSVVMPATCESNGHIFGHGAQCVFCGTDKQEHADHAES